MRSFAYVTACAGALVALLAAPSQLWAQDKEYRVTIDTEPSGAAIWIDDRAGDPDGTTPYDTRLATGKHTIFLELDGYEVSVKEVTVKKRRRGKQSFSFELEEQSTGSIDVLAADGSDHTDGARVFLDGREVGTVPDSFEASTGSHQVEVVKDGYKRHESQVEVTAGESVELTVALNKLKAGGQGDKGKGDKGKGDKGKGKGDKSDEPTSPILRLDAGLGSVIRRVEYLDTNGVGNLGVENLRSYTAPGIAMANLSLELNFGWLSSALARFTLFGAASLSMLGNSEAQDPAQPLNPEAKIDIATTWFRREVGLRVQLGPVSIDLAEARSEFNFDPDALEDAEIQGNIADAQYEYLRLGLWYARGDEKMNFGVGASGMYVLSRTGLADHFTQSEPSVFGLGANAWFRMHLFAGVEGSITGSATYFAYSMEPENTRDTTGAYDLMLNVVGSAGYRF